MLSEFEPFLLAHDWSRGGIMLLESRNLSLEPLVSIHIKSKYTLRRCNVQGLKKRPASIFLPRRFQPRTLARIPSSPNETHHIIKTTRTDT